MAKENNIKQELLKHMDKNHAEPTDISSNAAWEIIAKHKTKVKRLKWITIICGLTTISYYILMITVKDIYKEDIRYLLNEKELWIINHLDTGLYFLVAITILFSILTYIQLRTSTMLHIYDVLSNIEQHLKKIAQDK